MQLDTPQPNPINIIEDDGLHRISLLKTHPYLFCLNVEIIRKEDPFTRCDTFVVKWRQFDTQKNDAIFTNEKAALDFKRTVEVMAYVVTEEDLYAESYEELTEFWENGVHHCPICGQKVKSVFDHVDQDCELIWKNKETEDNERKTNNF